MGEQRNFEKKHKKSEIAEREENAEPPSRKQKKQKRSMDKLEKAGGDGKETWSKNQKMTSAFREDAELEAVSLPLEATDKGGNCISGKQDAGREEDPKRQHKGSKRKKEELMEAEKDKKEGKKRKRNESCKSQDFDLTPQEKLPQAKRGKKLFNPDLDREMLFEAEDVEEQHQEEADASKSISVKNRAGDQSNVPIDATSTQKSSQSAKRVANSDPFFLLR